MKDMKVLLYYKFVKLKNPKKFIAEHRKFCEGLGILGKVLVAKEGINGSVSGTYSQTEKYKKFINSYKEFSDIKFKEEGIVNHTFTKMITRLKDEIVAFKKPVDTSKGGKHLKPQEFLDMVTKDEEIILLDARNDYEYKVGRFKGAINPKIKTFREFPKFVKSFEENKDKKIVMYCTGGIRCEKASAYMIEQGFKNVYQLDGGIITFCQEKPDTLWEGQCFVFDKRLITDVEKKGDTISECINCGKKSDLYKNCRYPKCDKLVIMCNPCQLELDGSCSIKCRRDNLEYFNKKSFQKRVEKSIIN
jgi:UPF0176 protein